MGNFFSICLGSGSTYDFFKVALSAVIVQNHSLFVVRIFVTLNFKHKSYIKDFSYDSPLTNLVLHIFLTPLAEHLNRHGWVTRLTNISEVALYLEIVANSRIFDQRIWIYSGFIKFIIIVLNEGSVNSESADHGIFERTLVHYSEIDVSTEEGVFVYVNYNFG